MEMEFMAEFTERMSPDRDRDRARRIVKGKRTKRQRPCSPFGMYTSAASGNSRCNSRCNSSGDGAYCLIDDITPDRSPVLTLSSETSTEEDEDMANCLIMLARSVSVSPVKEEKSDQIRQRTEKLSSRRFTEMTATANATVTATTAGGKGGVYVYECKTCNRTFPSFQALGGHRASHKKPKVNVDEKKSSSVDFPNFPPSMTEYSENDHEHDYDQRKVVEDEESKRSMMLITNNVEKSPSPSPSRGNLVQTGTITITNNKRKIHECSICGSEFSSGQALGGHMRKHRPIPPSVNRTGSVINTDEILTADQSIEKPPGTSTGILSLDLNFPPPEMIDGDVQSKFQFTANPSQHMLFSSPALIDCHY